MTLDESRLTHFRAAQERNQRLSGLSPASLELGGGGGDSGGTDGLVERVTRLEVRLDAIEHRLGGVEGRMDRLETRMDAVDARLRSVEQSLYAVSAKLDPLTTQVVAKLPSWWQMPAVIGSTVTVLAAPWAAGRWLASRGLL